MMLGGALLLSAAGGISIGVGHGASNAPSLEIRSSGTPTHTGSAPATLTANATTSDSDGSTTIGVDLYESGVLVGAMTNGGGGNWSYALSALGAGTYSYTARRVTASGSVDSSSWALVVSSGAHDVLWTDGSPMTWTDASTMTFVSA